MTEFPSFRRRDSRCVATPGPVSTGEAQLWRLGSSRCLRAGGSPRRRVSRAERPLTAPRGPARARPRTPVTHSRWPHPRGQSSPAPRRPHPQGRGSPAPCSAFRDAPHSPGARSPDTGPSRPRRSGAGPLFPSRPLTRIWDSTLQSILRPWMGPGWGLGTARVGGGAEE